MANPRSLFTEINSHSSKTKIMKFLKPIAIIIIFFCVGTLSAQRYKTEKKNKKYRNH